MSLRSTSFALSIPLLAILAACGTSASGPTGGGASTTDGGGAASGAGGSTSVPEDTSGAPRAPASEVPPSSLAAAVAANNAFAVDLYAHVRAGAGTDNLLTAPLSASLALTMTYAGAKGSTATGMATALHFEAPAQTIFAGQNALDQALATRAGTALAADRQAAQQANQPAPSPGQYQLQIVNAVWGEKTFTWATPFLDVLATDYGTGVYLTDFITGFAQAQQTINAWVSAETAGEINGLLPPGTLDATTRMVLVDAIHLKLHWASPFDPGATADGNFTTGAGPTLSAPLMNQTSTLQYVDDGEAQIVSLPLVGNQLSVVIALPHGDLATYEAGLTAGSAALTPPSSYATVALTLPKFTFTSPSFALNAPLQAMGMAQAFAMGGADFQGMCASPMQCANLYIKDVFQKDTIAVQETGVEASAATAVVVDCFTGSSTGGPPPTPVPMVVNRPFLMAIVDGPTGAILFLGHIEDPTQTM